MLFGTPRKPAPADSGFQPPAKRRVIWEHAQDLAVFLRINIIYNILFFITLFLNAIALVVIINRPPFIVDQDQGYAYYRNTEQYRLRTPIIETFLQVTTGKLYTYQPGSYDISGLENLVYQRILAEFGQHARDQADERLQNNRRQLWYMREIRRYYDAKLPQYIAVAVRGEKIMYEDSVNSEGIRDIRTTSEPMLLMTYLKQVVPTPDNPWGLMLYGIYPVADKKKADLLWENTEPLGLSKNPSSNKKDSSTKK